MIYKNIIKKKIKEKIEIINHNLFKIFSNKTNAILLYHRILPQVPNFTLGNEICVEEFESQIKYLKLNYDIVPLNFESSNKKNTTISLSFDDGYKDNYLYAQAGAGIVADSKPVNEFIETENKAKALLKAME